MGKDRDAFAESKAVEHLKDSQSSKSMQIGDMNPDNKISLEHLVGLFEPSERASLLRSIHLFVPGEHDIAVWRIISKLHTSLLTPGGLDFNSVLNIMLRFDEEGRRPRPAQPVGLDRRRGRGARRTRRPVGGRATSAGTRPLKISPRWKAMESSPSTGQTNHIGGRTAASSATIVLIASSSRGPPRAPRSS